MGDYAIEKVFLTFNGNNKILRWLRQQRTEYGKNDLIIESVNGTCRTVNQGNYRSRNYRAD